ncbi:uncharacterized protein LOC127568899 [Pristis pectinata]|uniref:uncharacterized protein LOC127568899 n=1 Tax=Pristis pectinata TaxID=685728 RepID=UPI00223D382A|nr:uncharacterized protein LOC127568899 [Pristis pectinata]
MRRDFHNGGPGAAGPAGRPVGFGGRGSGSEIKPVARLQGSVAGTVPGLRIAAKVADLDEAELFPLDHWRLTEDLIGGWTTGSLDHWRLTEDLTGVCEMMSGGERNSQSLSPRIDVSNTRGQRVTMPADLRRQVDSTRLVSPSKSLILLCGEMDHVGKEKELEEVVVVNMSGRYLINLGYLTNCRALTICILPRNYITKIDALSNCPNLIKLDLHSNHITELPDEYFWSDMKYLQVLYLHDNIIGDVDNTEALSACPQLTVLTLFDTPVSLMPKYRHFIVNNIWSLKALDNFVIADEEVMEDWPRNDKFKALNPEFLLDVPEASQISTWCSELENIRNLMATINNILAHHSPVHIIQRWIRGHLTRKRLRATSDPGQQCVSCAEVNMCGRGIHRLEDGSLWVEKSSSRQDGRCCAVQLQINELQVKTLEARYEAKEITSGVYPCISERKRWNLKLQKSSPVRDTTLHRPNVTPQVEGGWNLKRTA